MIRQSVRRMRGSVLVAATRYLVAGLRSLGSSMRAGPVVDSDHPNASRAVTVGVQVRSANSEDRSEIFRLRHEVYAVELGHHPVNADGSIDDSPEVQTEFLVAESGGKVVGFIGVTAPTSPRYAIEKYVDRAQMPLVFDSRLFEIRALTVAPTHRRGPTALLLMRAAWESVRRSGGDTIFVMGRQEALGMYQKVGLKPLDVSLTAGAVQYQVMAAGVDEIGIRGERWRSVSERVQLRSTAISRELLPLDQCYHGGAFFDAIGDRFDNISRRHSVISADVLDAWFPPAPSVIAALQDELPWLLATSPPTHGEGLIETIATTRRVPAQSLVLGAGSSTLIFTALRHWLEPESRVLVLDPSYSEYQHVLSKVIGCHVDRLVLDATRGFRVESDRLATALARGYDLVVIVNPNNPTGMHVPVNEMRAILESAPPETRIWIDEAYVEYAGVGQSLETLAGSSDQIVVCKSFSKTYALSGARAAYLVAPREVAAALRAVIPPWAVSLPAQLAAVRALQSPIYYQRRYEETRVLRRDLRTGLEEVAPWQVIEGVINSLLCLLPPGAPRANAVVAACRDRGLFVRDWSDGALAGTAIRVSVKDASTNLRTIEILRLCLKSLGWPAL